MSRVAILAALLLMAGCATPVQPAVPLEGNMMVYEYCGTGLKSVHYLNTERGDEVHEVNGGRGLRLRHAGDTHTVDIGLPHYSIRWMVER